MMLLSAALNMSANLENQQWPQDWKKSVFIPMPKNVQTTIQFHSSWMLVRLCSKSFNLGFSSMSTKNFQIYNLGLEMAEEAEIKLPTFLGS